jgi:hypothetical protein
LDRYRPWVYGIGFGWQLGVGVATFVMSASVYLMVVVAAATGEPILALASVTLFGLIRGLAILPAAGVRTPFDLGELHRRFERWRPASRVVALAGQVGVLALAVTMVGGWVAGLVAGVALSAVAWVFRRGLSDPTPKVRIPDSPAELTLPDYMG